MYFHLSNGGSPRFFKKTQVELAIKLLHPTSTGNTFFIQPFLTHNLADPHIFPTYADVPSRNLLHKGPLTMTISGRFVVNAISVGNVKLCFKSVATCQSVQPSSKDGLRIFLRASFEIFPSLTN